MLARGRSGSVGAHDRTGAQGFPVQRAVDRAGILPRPLALLVAVLSVNAFGMGRPAQGQELETALVLAADPSTRRVGLVDATGQLLWEYPIRDCSDAWRLSNSNLLFQVSWTQVLEVKLDKTIVWSYQAGEGQSEPGVIQSAQRLDNDLTLIAEAGTDRLIEVDAQGNLKTLVTR